MPSEQALSGKAIEVIAAWAEKARAAQVT